MPSDANLTNTESNSAARKSKSCVRRRGKGEDARLVIRILIILWADRGYTIRKTAELLGCCEQTVLNWCRRFLELRSEGPVAALMDLPRSGRPPVYGTQERVQVVAVVYEILHRSFTPRTYGTDL